MLSQKDHVEEASKVRNKSGIVRDELSSDLDKYSVKWRPSELGPHRRSKSPGKSLSRTKQVASNSKSGNDKLIWDLEGLKGASTSSAVGHPADPSSPTYSQSSRGSIDAVRRPIISTESFTITEHGNIIYK